MGLLRDIDKELQDMAYNLFDLDGNEWHSLRTLDGARKKAYSLIDGAPYRSTVFIYNGTRYIGTVKWFRTVDNPTRNIYNERIVYVSGKNIWGLYNDGSTYKIQMKEETVKFVSKLVADARRTFHSEWEIRKK